MKPKPASLTPNEGIYRKLSVRMYGDAKFARLSPMAASGQSLFIYILTGPHTGPIPGVFIMGRAAMAEALNWDTTDFDGALKEVTAAGMVEFDQVARLWFIPNALKHNLPHNPNVVLSWRSVWPLLPECDLRFRIGRHFHKSLAGLSPAFGAAFAKVCADQSPNDSPNDSASGSGIDPADDSQGHSSAVGVNEPPKQEQEQDQEQQQEQQQKNTKKGPARKRAPPQAAFVSLDVVVGAGVDPRHAADWLAVRRTKNLPLTETAWEETQAEALKAGMTIGNAVKRCAAEGWAGFKASWMQRDQADGRGAGGAVDDDAKRQARLAEARALIEARGRVPCAVDVIDVPQQAGPAVSMRMLGYESPHQPDTVFGHED